MKKELLKELFELADYDYKKAEFATVWKGGECYDLMPMLDEVKDIKKVIGDLKNGWIIIPF